LPSPTENPSIPPELSDAAGGAAAIAAICASLSCAGFALGNWPRKAKFRACANPAGKTLI